ncbi:hypothetical protein J7E50_10770 [Pedobacter sp. ISL-68]|uniref:hypothetical protein n=1 Tax=unclassified Pedobacter TaxID=2628915 RepID=UPI001BE82520|nr:MULTISPECIES: hypothetical protein [unclassified Pedobacter]MBT2561314.1 hypothetical protein [Pedobacter sp. ISL-64]MBT2590703.1 hypothetical protein [Pedobacter sp. ISL-68]
MKRLLLTGSLIMAAATLSFAGNPKGESKTETPTEAKSTAGQTLQWYIVSYDNPSVYPNGYIKSGSAAILTGDKNDAEQLDECPNGANYDCLRGFASAPSLPTGNAGTDQVKTDVQP